MSLSSLKSSRVASRLVLAVMVIAAVGFVVGPMVRGRTQRAREELSPEQQRTAAVLLDLFWRPAADSVLRFLPSLGLCITGGVAMELVATLAGENGDLRRRSAELAKKLGMR